MKRPLAVAFTALAGAAAARAQDPAAAEPPPAEFSVYDDPTRMPGFMGQSRAGFLTRFDNSFNPAFAVVIDALGELSDNRDNGARFNQFRVRTLELNAASRLDPLGWGYATVAFVDTGLEREVELEEAALWLDQLPANFSLRGGRFLADFGKWNTFHTHDKPFVHEDAVRREYFGGPLFLTGVELHHFFGLGEVPVRWSVGVSSSAEGDDHDAQPGGADHAHDGEFVGRRGLSNWNYTGRITGQHDVGDNGYFQWGFSALYNPAAIEIEAELLPGGGERLAREEFRKAVAAIDLTYRAVQARAQTAQTVSLEFWRDQSEFHDPAENKVSEGHNGVWGFAEYAFSPRWSSGLIGSWAEHATALDGGSFFGGGAALAETGAYLTWNLSEFHRIRLQVDHLNPGGGFENSWVVSLQWTGLMGVHAHSIDW